MNETSSESIRVLLVEDDPGDADLLRELLSQEKSPSFQVEWVDRLEKGLERLSKGRMDVVLLDLSLPDSQGLATAAKVHAKATSVPIVVLTGLDDDTFALEVVRSGAQDYLVKGEVDGNMLSRVMRYAIERKKLEQLKDDFVNTVSHELRSPLAIVKEGITLMLEDALGIIQKEQRDLLETVDDNIDRLTELIANLLDLSKVQAGRLHLIRREVNLGELIQVTLKRYRLIAGQRTLKAHCPPVPTVFADPDRILQVFGNFLSNAIKFTPEDGTITFTLEEREGDVAVLVQDNGVGITQRDIPKLFRKFSQVGSDEGQRKGTGLGLALCKELIELHGGTVSVASELGKGTVFTFTLPLYTIALALEEGFKALTKSAPSAGRDEMVGMIVVRLGAVSQARLEEVIRQQIHREDVVVRLEPHWLVILAMTDGEGLKDMVKRLQPVLLEWGKGLGTALYPTDAPDVHGLFSKATGMLPGGVHATASLRNSHT